MRTTDFGLARVPLSMASSWSPLVARSKSPVFGCFLVVVDLGSSFRAGLFHAVAVAVGDDDVAVVQEPVEHADCGGVFGQEAAPGLERPVRPEAEGAAFVGGGEPEQQLGAGVIEWGEPELVEDNQVVTEQALDDLADAIVGQTSVEGID